MNQVSARSPAPPPKKNQREDRLLVTHIPVEFQLFRKLPNILEEFVEYTQFSKEKLKMSTCSQLDLETL